MNRDSTAYMKSYASTPNAEATRGKNTPMNGGFMNDPNNQNKT